MSITRVIPQRWPIALGGTTYLVPPLRLRDIATLQAWIAVASPCPLESSRSELGSTEGEARRAMLADLYARCEAWPIRYGSVEGGRLLSTLRGALAWLSVVLGRAVPSPSAEDLDQLAPTITPDDWRRLASIAFETDPLDELIRLIDPDPNAEPARADDIDWSKAFAEVAESTGWTFDQIADLTLGQWVAIRTGGKAVRGVIAPRDGETAEDAARRWNRLLHGTDDPAPTEADVRRQTDAEALFAKHWPKGVV